MNLPRREEAAALWENGRTMLKLIDQVRTCVHTANTKALKEHKAATTPGTALEPETQQDAHPEGHHPYPVDPQNRTKGQ